MKKEISTENNKFKKEMIFALIWIGTYFLLVILANILSNIFCCCNCIFKKEKTTILLWNKYIEKTKF
jgi:hypothetical protein